tara:strand:+ start:3566 stop:3781 length:216 start_codon:yes stop_codon:yes gene_type:complete
MVKTIELKKSDYDYYEQYGMYCIKKKHYEKHPESDSRFICKRKMWRGKQQEDYWGFLGDEDGECKIKWIED